MGMRDYDRDRDFRNPNGANGYFGQDQQPWQNDWSSSQRSTSSSMDGQSRGEWSTRPRYGYGYGGMGDEDVERYGRRDDFDRFSMDRNRNYQSNFQGNYQGNYQRDYQRNYHNDEPGLWDRFKGEMREGWDRLRGEPEQRGMYGRGQERSYDRGYDSRGRDEGFWDEAKREAREGWNKVKETFRGRGPKGYARSDDRIREDVCDRLSWHSEIDAYNLEVTVKDGEVELSGTVPERRQKRLAEDVVEDIMGVKDVSNRIRVARETTSMMGSTTGTTHPTNNIGQTRK